MSAFDLLVDRADLARTQIDDATPPTPADGEAVLRVDRVGMTANNVTYALVGDSMRYWDFFPAEAGWGRVPLWGFANVEASAHPLLEAGTRVYGYLPTSSHLVVRPADVDDAGFKDTTDRRQPLPAAYNVYATTTGDPAYEAEHEDLQILYRPLFITSFMLADFFDEQEHFGAEQIVLTSASSKTAYGTAFCLRQGARAPRLIGLTSKRNESFTRTLGCYDEVIAYDDVVKVPLEATVIADMAGDAGLRAALHAHLGHRLRHDAVVGATHLDARTIDAGAGELPGPKPVFFFAPDRLRKRRADWGPRGIETRFGQAWRAFVPTVVDWVRIEVSKGPEALRDAWLATLAGRVDPATGLIVQL